jgi:hypothetical protein
MPPLALPDLRALTHLAGFGAGAALYAMLGVMAARAPRRRGDVRNGAEAAPRDRIPVAAALLGLAWNLGALLLYGGRGFGGLDATTEAAAHGAALVFVGAVAFAALGFLPAVVVHAALLGATGRARRSLTALAYALSGAGAGLHLWDAAVAGGHTPSRAALLLLTVGYAVLLTVVWVRLRRQPGARGPLAAAALGSFAVTALHLSQHAPGHGPVWELVGHHASIPLALVILYQDWRFALADLFLKRALAALAVVAGTVAAHVLVIVPVVLPRLAADPADPWAPAVLALLVGVALTVAAPVRRRLDAFVDRVVLRRPDYVALRTDVAAAVARSDDERTVLDAACARLAPALAAEAVRWAADADAAGGDGRAPRGTGAVPVVVGPGRQSARVVVPTAEAPEYHLDVGALRGGRRLLSDDVALLEHVALLAARRIDVLRIAHERCTREAHALETERLAAEAELRALRAQLQPHFLFNALTTIAWLVQSAPDRALVTLHRLTELLRAVLRSPPGELVALGEEVAIVEAYLAIETARFEERLQVVVDVAGDARAVAVPPMLLQPLVENAVKHGISPLRAGGRVTLRAWLARGDDDAPVLRVDVCDTGAGADPAAIARRQAAGGLGLASVERRLARLFDGRATFAVHTAPGEGFAVALSIPATVPARPTAPDDGAGVPPSPRRTRRRAPSTAPVAP